MLKQRAKWRRLMIGKRMGDRLEAVGWEEKVGVFFTAGKELCVCEGPRTDTLQDKRGSLAGKPPGQL